MRENKKYTVRFGVVLAIALSGILLSQSGLKIIIYKASMVAVAVGLAELIWGTFFKPVYGKTEEMNVYERKDILIFRGILYAAIILALTLGL